MSRLALLLCLSACSLFADGLGDLRNALTGLKGQTPVKGTVEVSSWRRSGEGKEATETSGGASAWVEDGPQGLKMQWSRQLLQQVDQEALAKKANPQAKTPATVGLGAMGPRQVNGLLNAAGDMLRTLDGATLTGEAKEAWNGRQVRVLSFTLPLTGMGERERKMVKEFKLTAKVWIDDDGTPLAMSSNANVSGRAYVVFTFSQADETTTTYAKVGDRLVVAKSETKGTQGGTEKGASRSVRSFKVQ